MTIAYLLLFLLTGACLHRSEDKDKDYLRRETTTAVKGFFTVFVFMRHFLEYAPALQQSSFQVPGLLINQAAGQLIVVMYLFYSGYGIWESAKQKGKSYVQAMPLRKVGMTLLRFDIAVLCYLLLRLVMNPERLTGRKILLAFIGLESLGNSCWYMFCILIMYSIAFLALRCAGTGRSALACVWCGVTLYMICMWAAGRSHVWYDTAWCFALGCCWSAEKDRIHKHLKDREMPSIACCAAAFALFYGICYMKPACKPLCYPVASLFFCLMLVQITRYIRLKSTVLSWLGSHLFPIYMYQRWPMIVLGRIAAVSGRPYLYFILSVILTLLAAAAENSLWNRAVLRKKQSRIG